MHNTVKSSLPENRYLTTKPEQSYLRDWIYGGIDGAVTTFAIVSGAIGGNFSHIVIIILGCANLIADGFSMAASNFVGTKSEMEQYNRYKNIEMQQISQSPEVGKQTLQKILLNYNVSDKDAKKMVDLITANKHYWIEMMLHEKYGLPKIIRSPFKAASSTFIAFIICGLFPIFPYFMRIPYQFEISILLTAVVFLVIGSIKSVWSLHSWWRSGISTLFIGAGTASLAFLIGYGLKLYIH